MTAKLPNAHKIYTMVVIYSKWPKYITTFSIPRSSKIYPKEEFWSEKKPSGNPVFCNTSSFLKESFRAAVRQFEKLTKVCFCTILKFLNGSMQMAVCKISAVIEHT
jgi:hypothetical protein